MPANLSTQTIRFSKHKITQAVYLIACLKAPKTMNTNVYLNELC